MPGRGKWDAVLSLRPEGGFHINNEGEVEYLISGGTEPSKAEIDAETDRLEIEWTAQEYARNRVSEYPSTGDQMDMIYKDMKNSTTTHAGAVEAVKTKWPKDNSGPVE